MNRNPLHQEIAKLRAQLDEANETIQQMRGETAPLIGVADLTYMQAIVVGLILLRGKISKGAIFAALYADRNEPPGNRILDRYMERIRDKLSPRNIEITTLKGFGFEIDKENADRLRELVRVESPSLVPEQVAV